MWIDGLNYFQAPGCQPEQNWQLAASSPPQDPEEPLSVAVAKGFIKVIDGLEADEIQDDQIEQFCQGARRVAEFMQAKDFIRRTLDLSMDYWPGMAPISNGFPSELGSSLAWFSAIELRWPLVSVESVSYLDRDNVLHTLDPDVDYAFDARKRIPILFPRPDKSWPSFVPWPSGAITIRLTTGVAPDDTWWAVEGSHVMQGMKYLVHHYYHNRDAFNRGIGNIEEFPYTVTQLLEFGAISRP